MDAVALVGRAHDTREREVLELAQLMPRGRFLGVMLVGATNAPQCDGRAR